MIDIDDWTTQDPSGHLINGDYTIIEVNGKHHLMVTDFNAYDYETKVGEYDTEALAMEAAE